MHNGDTCLGHVLTDAVSMSIVTPRGIVKIDGGTTSREHRDITHLPFFQYTRNEKYIMMIPTPTLGDQT